MTFGLNIRLLLVYFFLAFTVRAAPAQVFPDSPAALNQEDIESMVKAISEELLDRYHSERHWDPETLPVGNTKQEGGRTALVCVALLDAGIPAQNEKLLKAIRALSDTSITGSYARAVCLMVYSRLPDEYLELAAPDLQGLIKGFDNSEGGWSYYEKAIRSTIDNSIIQLCILGLSDLADRGVRVPPAIFDAVRTRYLRLQGADGGWGYKGPAPTTGSMTAAGVATLALCNKHVPPNKKLKETTDRAIRRGIEWIDSNFIVRDNPNNEGYWGPWYWLFSAARAGQAVAVRSFGTHNWLCEGAAEIANRMLAKNNDGSWRVKSGSNTNLAFSLLYLTRGLKTVSFGAFVDSDASVDSIGLSPAVHEIDELIEAKTVWQQVSINDPLDSWLRTPVVLVQGTTPPSWASEDVEPLSDPVAARLMSYAQHGGLVIFAPERRGDNFVKAVKSWASRALPNREWTPINRSQTKAWHKRAAGIGPPTREWFIMLEGIDPMGAMLIKGRRQTAAIEVLSDCWTHVTNGNPWSRRKTKSERPEIAASSKGTGDLILVSHEGEWNAEPITAGRAAEWLLSETGHELWVQEVTPEVLGESNPKGSVAWIRGGTAQEASALSMAPFVSWLEKGGGLLIEQTGGNGDFATTFATTLANTLEARVVPSLRPPSFPAEGSWPASVLSIRKENKTLAYVSTADCSLSMLKPREVPGEIGVSSRVTTAMLADLIPPKK